MRIATSILAFACLVTLTAAGCSHAGSDAGASTASTSGHAGVTFPEKKMTPQQYQQLMQRLSTYPPYLNSLKREQEAVKKTKATPRVASTGTTASTAAGH